MQTKSITTFDFESNIWQVHAHPTLAILLVETRNADTRTVQFSAVDIIKNEVLWNTLNLGDDWWRSFETMTNTYLVLHGFEDAHNPVSSGVYVFDMFTGEKVYANDNSVFIKLEGDLLIEKLTIENDEVYSQVNLLTGQKSTISVPSIISATGENRILIPSYIEAEESSFNKIEVFINRYHSNEKVLSIEYLETQAHIAVAWIQQEENQLNHYIMLVDSLGNLVFKELIAENMKGKSPGAFLVAHHTIAFVKDSTALWYYPL